MLTEGIIICKLVTQYESNNLNTHNNDTLTVVPVLEYMSVSMNEKHMFLLIKNIIIFQAKIKINLCEFFSSK